MNVKLAVYEKRGEGVVGIKKGRWRSKSRVFGDPEGTEELVIEDMKGEKGEQRKKRESI